MKDLCSFHSGSRDHVTQLKTGCGLLVFMTSFFNIDHYLSLDLEWDGGAPAAGVLWAESLTPNRLIKPQHGGKNSPILSVTGESRLHEASLTWERCELLAWLLNRGVWCHTSFLCWFMDVWRHKWFQAWVVAPWRRCSQRKLFRLTCVCDCESEDMFAFVWSYERAKIKIFAFSCFLDIYWVMQHLTLYSTSQL